MALWLIAAILATLILCDVTDPEPDPAGTLRGVDVDFEIAE